MTGITIAMIWMALLSGIEAIGLTLLRMEGSRTLLYRAAAASAIYALAVVPLLIKALEYDGIGMVNFLWNVFSTIVMFIIGIYVFDEKVANLQLIGVILSLGGLALILMADKQ
jgi:multidrug transporter EmrE-like cation transporter